ncbi:hypothetical protein BS329_38700 [Amycolatopsis coloradensis]|uniref:Uncharacterized protein n=1 Tax=Amycolatopsis coloradensis TaxID=76021 RepID=A0A1R0KEK1_9PSEU|nr:hypothetical protein [Amycolatopsis coloradensis]OLZ43589.1 hypothetical protein BS329_38700 [Amycolatopsis coloradensis]
MRDGRHHRTNTSRTLVKSAEHGRVGHAGLAFLLLAGGVILGTALTVAVLAGRLYFGLPLIP